MARVCFFIGHNLRAKQKQNIVQLLLLEILCRAQ